MVVGYGMLLDRIRQRDVDGAPRQRVIPVAVNQLDGAVDVDGRDAPRRALHAEDGPGGHLGTVGVLYGADLYALCIGEHIASRDMHRHAAASGRALDGDAAEDLLLHRGYGMLRGDPNGVAYAAPSDNRCCANKGNLPRILDLDFCCVVGDDAVCVC